MFDTALGGHAYHYVTAEHEFCMMLNRAVNGLFTFIMFINDEKGDGGSV